MPERNVTLSVVSHRRNALVNQLLEDIQRHCADRIEIHTDAISKGERILLVDDLPDIGGRKRLEKLGLKVFTLCEFEGE